MARPWALYNEIDPYAAQWLRNLILAGVIAPGVVDTRSIEDICPDELREFRQVHFFAGIGIWSGALREVGWPDDFPIWSMSCPCQPFSAAGKGAGFADERHLWPAAFHLITQCRPERIVGEQVASPDGLAWIDLVQTDLEGADYAPRAVDTCAAGYGAPNLRQRLYWDATCTLADARCASLQCGGGRGEAPCTLGRDESQTQQRERGGPDDRSGRTTGVMADAHNTLWGPDGAGRDNRDGTPAQWEQGDSHGGECGYARDMADAHGTRRLAGEWDGASARHGFPVAPSGDARDMADATGGKRGIERLTREPGRSGHLDGGQSPSVAQGDASEPGPQGHAGHGDDGTGRPVAAGPVATPGVLSGLANSYLPNSTQERAGDDPLDQQWQANGRGTIKPAGIGAGSGVRGGHYRTGSNAVGSPGEVARGAFRPAPVNGFWADADWISCRDGRWRPVEGGTFPLAHGDTARLGRLRAYGNALNLQQAAGFLREALSDA